MCITQWYTLGMQRVISVVVYVVMNIAVRLCYSERWNRKLYNCVCYLCKYRSGTVGLQ